MRSLSILKLGAAILLLAACGAVGARAQEAKAPEITKGVHWSDARAGVEVFLAYKATGGLRLTVISDRDVKVIYRTSINSVEPVEKVLAPVDSTGGSVRHYEFEHNFTKMTIWMGLEFAVDGKMVPDLTRAFYNDIFTLAPPNHYFGPKGKGRT